MLKLLNKFKEIKKGSFQKYLLASLLMAVALYPKFPFLRIPGTYVSIRLEDFLLVLVGISTLILYAGEIRSILKNKVYRAVLIFFLVGAVSVSSAILITKSAPLHLSVLHLLRRVEYFIPLFAAGLYLKSSGNKSVGFYIKLLMIIILILFLYGYGQKHMNFPVIITQNEEYSKGIALRWTPGSHINATFAGHYDLATFLVLVLPVVVSTFFLTKNRLLKLVFASSFFGGLWLLSNAASRISIVSFWVATTLSLLLLRKFKALLGVLIVSFVFFSFSGDLMARYVSIFSVTYKNIMNKVKIMMVIPKAVYAQDSTEAGLRKGSSALEPTPAPVFEDRSTSIRINVEWPRAIKAFYKNPLLGTGYSSISLATDNDYLRLLGEVGLLGFISFMLIIVRVTQVLYKGVRHLDKLEPFEKALVAGIFGGFVGVLVNAVFIDVFEASKLAIILWLLIGLTIGLIDKKTNVKET